MMTETCSKLVPESLAKLLDGYVESLQGELDTSKTAIFFSENRTGYCLKTLV
ncbi:hypothetical protein [Evansella tamaricis]|uniref:hypothetical protein n=1 Tax=Evansella tamaricis TaxID=2069301 RepID=UPI003631D80B